MKKITFIGCGNMGEAILKGLLQKRLFNRRAVIVSDYCSERRSYLKRTYGVNTSLSNISAVKQADIVMLCVKPQDVKCALGEIASLAKNKLIISIAAGITISYIKKLTGAKRIARAMPNIAALAGYGISGISFSSQAAKSDIKQAEDILASAGKVIRVNENRMNAVTAISGSGPAYFYLLMEAMIKAAVSLGISQKAAAELVLETAGGASLLQKLTALSPLALRKKVTSKGGTTEAALKVFSKRGFERIVSEAVKQAAKKAKELSR